MPKAIGSLKEKYRIALVTGASSGIGLAVAQALLEEGLEVYGTTREPEKADLVEEIRWLRLEGGTPEGRRVFTRHNSELLGQVDILVNNAGAGQFGSLPDRPIEAIDQQLQLLLHTPIVLTREVLSGMQPRGKGCIVNVSSLAATFPLPFMPAYTSAKAGLSAFTRSLIVSHGTDSVSLIDFQAGDFRTAFNEHASRPAVLNPREQVAWDQLEKHLQAAPNPERAARDMMRAIRQEGSRVVRSGGFFQTRIAPIGSRILPVSWLLSAIRWYYKLPSG